MSDGRLRTVIRQLQHLAGAPEACDLTDRQLLERFAACRDEAAFAALVRRHGALVLGVCWRVLHHEQDAEDVFQATFLVLARKAAALRWHTSVGNWLHETAYRLAAKARVAAARRRARERQAAEQAKPQDLPQAAWEQLAAVLDEALASLPARYRTPLVLCYLEGQTRDQAARQLGWSLGTLKRRLEHGRELLRVQLGRRGLVPPAAVLATILAHHTASAAVPSVLAAETTRAAVALTAVPAGGVGGGATAALALADGLLRGMAATRLKILAALILTFSLLGTGAGVLVHHLAARPPADARTEGQLPGELRPPPKAAGRINAPASDRPEADLPGPEPRRLVGHRGRVNAIAFSPDGKTMASAGADKVVYLWDVATGKIIRSFRGHDHAVQGVAFSLDGKLAASAGAHTVRLWQLATGGEIRKLMHAGTITSIAFAPDGTALATAEGQRGAARVHFWNVALGKQAFQWTAGQNGAGTWTDLRVAFFPDGKRLVVLGGSPATADNDPAIRFLDVPTGKEITRLGSGAGCLALSPDGRTLAAGSRGPMFHLWKEFAARREVLTVQGHRDAVCSLDFAPDGRTVVSASRDRTVRLWEVATGKERYRLRGLRGEVTAVAFAPDGETLATAGDAGSVELWKVRMLVPLWRTRRDALAGELDGLWTDLGGADAARAYRAGQTLIRLAGRASPFLRKRLPPATEAMPAPAGPPAGEQLRTLRALEVLEQMSSPESRQLLQALAQGAPGAWLTTEAQAALQRLARQRGGRP